MAGHILRKRKTMKLRKRLCRPQKKNKPEAERIYRLLKSLKKVVRSQDSPPTHRRLDFGDNSSQKSHVLPQPTFYTPKGKDALVADFLRKFHSLADEVVSDDEDLSVQFAAMQINKPSTDYDSMLLECPNTDEKFFAALERSAKKLGMPKRLIGSLDEAAEPIEPKSESAIPQTKPLEEFEIASNPPLKKPEESSKIEIVSKAHEDRTEVKSDKVSAANLEINPKQPHNKPEKPQSNPPAKMRSNVLSDKLEVIPKLTENNPENSSKTGMPKDNPSAKLEIVPRPSVNKPEEISDEISKSKPSANLETVRKPPENTASYKIMLPQIVSKAAENKNYKLGVVPKPARKIPVLISSRKPMVKLEAAPKSSYETYMRTFSNIAVPDGNQTSSLTGFRFFRNTYKRFIVIDGSNVAFAHSNQRWFSSEGIHYCLQYFERLGHPAKAVLPIFRRNAFQSSQPQILDHLHKEGKIVFTPCKNLSGFKTQCYDDRFILQLAYELNAAVVSNDNFNDICLESREFKEIVENRVVGYCWCDNIFMLPKDPYGRWGPTLDYILQC